jgi:hypothetical protein
MCDTGSKLMVRAAGFGAGEGWMMRPPISQNEAENEFGAEISESAWLEICEAFNRHGQRLNDLEGTRFNENPNDTRGWRTRKTGADKKIEAALKALNGINRDFLREAENIVSLKISDGLEAYNSEELLNRALEEIMFLSWIVREVEPMEREIPTETESRKMLARDIFKALKASGAEVSNGWNVGGASYADLTGFERLIELMKVHEGETPEATSKWLREAMAQNR